MADTPTQEIESRLIKRLLHACVREQLLTHRFEENKLYITLPRDGKTILAENINRFTLDKFRINGDVLLLGQNEYTPLHDIKELMNLIHREMVDHIDPQAWQSFIYEIDNCKMNEAIIAKYVQGYNEQLAVTIRASGYRTLFEYIVNELTLPARFLFFERWAAAGHPYHPCHKTKLGFSLEDYMKFSPEFHGDIHLPLAAIAKEQLTLALEDATLPYATWFAQHFQKTADLYVKKMQALNLNPNDYYPFFVHPWQYENTLTKSFAHLIQQQQFILLPDITIKTKSSLSFRTLIAVDDATQPHIKLPVAIRSTSALRTISSASVYNGPRITKVLRHILRKENYFDHTLHIIHEICGLHINHEELAIEKHLGIIYRENPCTLIKEPAGILPVVVAALTEPSPVTGLPLFIEILQTTVGDELLAAEHYFADYSRIVIQAYLDLFLIYGIALEGHQQNTIAIFKDGRPQFMIARDFGGMCIHKPTFYAHGIPYEPHSDSQTLSDRSIEATNIFLHTVIQYHLGELIILLANHYRVSELVFWKIVKDQLQQRFTALKPKVASQRYKREYHAIMHNDWQLKGLMRMRLRNLYNKFLYIKHKNPLRET